ncbi:MAG: hypothetical protein QXT14_08830 [Candidatus Bathyarchaeia archaeon]
MTVSRKNLKNRGTGGDFEMAKMSSEEIEKRINDIIDFVKANGPVTVYDVANYLKRSAWTARAWCKIASAKEPRLVYRGGVLYYKEERAES